MYNLLSEKRRYFKINIVIFIAAVISIKFIDYYLSFDFFEWFAYALMPIVLLIIYTLSTSKIKYDKLATTILVLMIYMTVNTYIKSHDISLTLQSIVLYTSYFSLYIFLINSKFIEKNNFKYFSLFLIMSMFISFDSYVSEGRTLGIMGNPNLTAHCALLLLPMVLYFQRNNAILQSLSLMITLILIISTGSRSSLLAYFIMFLVLAIYKLNIKFTLKRNYLTLIFSLLLTILLIDLAPLIVNTGFVSDIVENTRYSYVGDNHRGIIWIEAFSIFREHIFTGAGIGIKFINEESGKILGFHNTYISILISGGMIGFLFFLVILRLMVRRNFNNTILSQYQMIQLVVFISISYSAEIFFIISYHFYILFIFQTFNLQGNLNEYSISNK